MHSVYNYSGFVDLVADLKALTARSGSGTTRTIASNPCTEQPVIKKKLYKTALPDKPEG